MKNLRQAKTKTRSKRMRPMLHHNSFRKEKRHSLSSNEKHEEKQPAALSRTVRT
jgi:hypothetical protein